MQLVREPKQFDVIVTGNLFGDILPDIAAMLTGSIGMLPSASLKADSVALRASAWLGTDIAGEDKANPLATTRSAALLRSLGAASAADDIERAVSAVLAKYREQVISLRGGGQQAWAPRRWVTL